MDNSLRRAICLIKISIPTLYQVCKAPDMMQKGDQTEDRLKPKGLSSKLCKDDVLRYCLFASNDAAEKKNLNSLN